MKFLVFIIVIISSLKADFIKYDTLEVVTNSKSNIIWQDSSENLSTTASWQEAISYCENLTLSGYDKWRLPNINELLSLSNEEIPFENLVSSNYWSSTTDTSETSKAWVVNFADESSDTITKSSNYFVRCVGDMETSCESDQKLEAGICIDKTCEEDGYNCQTPPKINSITLDSDTLFANSSVGFSSDITLSNSYISSYLWSFGDDILSTKETPSHAYEQAGEYNVTLTVKDSNDLTDTYTKTIIVNEEVDIKANFLPSVNQALPPAEITFYDLSSAQDGIAKWKWEVKDSSDEIIGISTKTSESSKNLTYEFDSAGEYTITLTITDNNAITSNSSQTVTILESKEDLGDVLILAGLGDNKFDPLYNSMYKLSMLSYKYLKYRGFSDDDIYLMFGNPTVDYNNDGKSDLIVDDSAPTASKFYEYIKNLATTSDSTKPLFIYMLDHGKKNVFMISNKLGSNGYVYGSELKKALDEFQSETDREVVLISEACYSGSFLSSLSNPTYENKRAMFFSSDTNELTYIGSYGGIAFSKYMFTNLLGGETLINSYYKAVNSLKSQKNPFKKQNPQYNKNISVELQSIKLGGDFATASVLPTIELRGDSDTTVDWSTKKKFTQSVKVNAIAGIKDVWAVVVPPDYEETNTTDFFTPNLDEYKVTLSKVTDDTYSLEYPPSIELNGDYSVFYFIEDNEGNIETTSSSVLGANGVTETTVNLSLIKGWNLVSLPVDTSIDKNSLNSKFSTALTLWQYSNGWKAHGTSTLMQDTLSNAGIKPIDTLTTGDGFWVNNVSADTIEFSGNEYDITSNTKLTSVSTGWHLLGSGSSSSASSIASANSDISTIWVYSNGWSAYSPNPTTAATLSGAGISELSEVNQGQGFWVNIK